MKTPIHLPEETIKMLQHLVQNGLPDDYVEKLLELCAINCRIGTFPTDDPTPWIVEMVIEHLDYLTHNVPEYYH